MGTSWFSGTWGPQQGIFVEITLWSKWKEKRACVLPRESLFRDGVCPRPPAPSRCLVSLQSENGRGFPVSPGYKHHLVSMGCLEVNEGGLLALRIKDTPLSHTQSPVLSWVPSCPSCYPFFSSRTICSSQARPLPASCLCHARGCI